MRCVCLFVVLCFVKCDDASNNYYVIEMPDDVPRDFKRPFRVYWNVPTIQCKTKRIPFDNLYEKYGIIQNEGDAFQGEKITILYEPGQFPAIFKNETSGKYRFRNGGVPQEGNLDEHLKVFKQDMIDIVPDPNFDGIGIIDFESWRPILRQNFGTLVPYKDVSYEIEKKLHWWWPKAWIHAEASQRFESAARVFMQTTLSIAKQMRPRALWGYYGFPHCFNMAGQTMMENCSPNVLAENDVTYWMWSESQALYPSVYSSKNLSTDQLGALVRGRVKEANRVRRYDTPVLPYYWFRYREGGFMTEEDLDMVLKSFYKSNASGFIIWGSSNDVNTVDKCKNFYNYVENILGPTIAKYIKKINIANDVIIETPPEINIDNETLTTSEMAITNKTAIAVELKENSTNDFERKGPITPELDWIPPVNYTQDISQNVEDELIKKGFNKTQDNIPEIKNLNDTAIVDMIFDALMKADSNENNKQTTRNIQDDISISNTINSIEVTKAPDMKIKSYEDTLSSMITKDPFGFIEKLAEDEIKVKVFDEIPQYKETTKEPNEFVLNSENNNWLPFNEKQESSYLSPYINNFSNLGTTNNLQIKESATTTTSKYNNIKQDFESEHDSTTLKPKNENLVIEILKSLLNNNNNINNEKDKQITKTEFNKIHTTNNIKEPVWIDLVNKDKLITTEMDYEEGHMTKSTVSLIDAHESTTERGSLGITLDKTPITEIDLSDIIENNFSTSSTMVDNNEDMISNEDINEFQHINDFESITNTSDLDFESTTQYIHIEEDYATDDLMILAVNLSSMVTENTTTTESIENKLTTEDVEASTKTDGLVTDGGSDEFTVDNYNNETLNDENFKSLTKTETTTDQVMTYI